MSGLGKSSNTYVAKYNETIYTLAAMSHHSFAVQESGMHIIIIRNIHSCREKRNKCSKYWNDVDTFGDVPEKNIADGAYAPEGGAVKKAYR